MTELLTQVEAERLLQKHSPVITKVIGNAWKRWRALIKPDPEAGSILSNRTRASAVYDYIRHEALAAFTGVEGVVVSEDRSFLLLTFDDRVILRFKKFRDKSMRIATTSTKQAREYANQVLPGMESLTHLVAGYLPDEVGIELAKAAITCQVDGEVKWFIDLDLTTVVGESTKTRDLATVTRVERHETQVGTIIRPRRAEGDETAPDQQASSER